MGLPGDPNRQKIVVYSFFGVNADENDPHDDGLVEYLRFERELRHRMPDLRVTETSPQAMLLDFTIDGQRLPNITWDDVERWVVDGTGFPTTDAAKQADLLRQVQRAFSERWIVWTEQATATHNGQTRTMTIEIRTWHGWEDGSDDIRLHARWRYLEAFVGGSTSRLVVMAAGPDTRCAVDLLSSTTTTRTSSGARLRPDASRQRRARQHLHAQPWGARRASLHGRRHDRCSANGATTRFPAYEYSVRPASAECSRSAPSGVSSWSWNTT